MDYSSCEDRLALIENGTLYQPGRSDSALHFANVCDTSTFKATLKEHQRRIVTAMQNLETKEQRINNEIAISTKMGVIADCVGSGKTYMIIAHLSANKIMQRRVPSIQNHGCSKIQLKFKQKLKHFTGNNLVVVPHSLIKQWSHIISLSDIKLDVICRTKHLIEWKESYASKGGITLVSSTFYNKFMEEYGHVYWGRVIYDECDILSISSFIYPSSNFYWFVTSSLQNLMFPSGVYLTECERESHMSRYISRYIKRTEIDGISKRGFIRDTFRSLERSDCNIFLDSIILKNKDSYVRSILDLPDIDYNFLTCSDPYCLNILNGIISKDIIELLNSGNTQAAIDKIGVNKNTEENIIQLVTKSMRIRLENKKQRLVYLNNILIERDTEKEAHEKRKTDTAVEISSIEENLQYIHDKITNRECPICFQDKKFPIILKCCKSVFCMECLSRSISICDNKCPMCRKWLEPDDLMAITQNEVLNHENVYDKYTTVKNLVNASSPGSKFLIFSMYDGSLKKIAELLNKTSHQICGTMTRINNIVTEYKTGSIDVLLLNASHYGNGLNLENTTDLIFFHRMTSEMEMQVIGRAQRLGRTDNLKVHYIVHQNERK